MFAPGLLFFVMSHNAPDVDWEQLEILQAEELRIGGEIVDENGRHDLSEPAESFVKRQVEEGLAAEPTEFAAYIRQHATAQFLVMRIPGVNGCGIGRNRGGQPTIHVWIGDQFDVRDEPKVRELYRGLNVEFVRGEFGFDVRLR